VSDLYSYACVQSVDDDGDWAWVIFGTGAMAQIDVSELDEIKVGAYVRVSGDLGDVALAPINAGFSRQFQTIAKLKHVDGPRSLLEIGDRIVAAESDSLKNPKIGAYYAYSDGDREWLSLTDAEAAVVNGHTTDEELPFAVEDLSDKGRGLGAVGGSETRVRDLIRLVRASFRSREPGYVDDDAKAISGAVFFGPPGTGKTHLARAIAEETSAQLITVSGPELVSKWVGATEQVIRQLFDLAREYPRSIIFFDEFDTIGSRRSADSHDYVNRQVGQLLATMDGADVQTRPFVIAATNRLEDVDPAFLRPGRFDYPVRFELPDESERRKILTVQAAQTRAIDPKVLAWLASVTDGWSPAELGLIWTHAQAEKDHLDVSLVSLEHVLSGFERARAQHTLIRQSRDSWDLENSGIK
jgi:hypothetical protein